MKRSLPESTLGFSEKERALLDVLARELAPPHAPASAALLPGRAAQERMLPPYRRGLPEVPPEGESWREAAVLILVHPGLRGAAFPLVKRSPHLGRHRGEIGLPGGTLEPGEVPLAAALRETQEELGLDSATLAAIRPLGALSPLRVPPSGFVVQPFVAALDFTPAIRPATPELEGVLSFRLLGLLDPKKRICAAVDLGGRCLDVPGYHAGRRLVWGATAMILAELEALLRRESSEG